MELQTAETKVYTGFEAVERMKTHWIVDEKRDVRFKFIDGVLNAIYEEEEIGCGYTVNYFFKNEFVDYVEPFKVGDWIVLDSEGCKWIGKFARKEGSKIYLSKSYFLTDGYQDDESDEDGAFYEESTFDVVRKATTEEITQEKRRRVFAKVGREVDEFKRGDVVTMSAGDLSEVIVEEPTCGLIKCVQFDGYNQTFETFNVNPKSLKLVVPVEQRLDKED